MAETIVSALLEQLTSTLSSETGTRLGRSSSIEHEVGELTDNFRSIQAVLKDAVERQVNDKVVRLWVDYLTDTSYEVEDALNEWNATAIRELQMKEAKANEDGSKLLKKVSSLTSSLCSDSRQAHQLHSVATKIKFLNERVDAIAREIEYFNFSSTAEATREPVTANFEIDLSEVYGRDLERNRLADFLLSNSSQDQESTLSIISVVGMGGIGKTTLAQLAYNDDKVTTRFDTKIWVSVTNHFDEIKIAKAILESLHGREDLVPEVDVLQLLHQSITGKRFLLVLDDVWIEDPKCWEGLKQSLNCGFQGSRILVTTRKESTAEAMGSTSTISLGKLSNDECWSIFRRVAFREMTREEQENFEDNGRKIASKCRGLPLVVMTCGHLCSQRNIAEWGTFLSSELWELKEVERDIFPSLLLSYNDLPYALKKCFLYCAIFPKDYYVTKDELVNLWTAQGYLEGIEEENMQAVGEKYFELLAKLFFFQHVERTEYNEIIGCRMGDIMHCLAKFLIKNECATVEFDDLANSHLDCHIGTRHLMITGKSISTSVYSRGRLLSDYQEKNLLSIYKEKKLRSLVFKGRIGHEVDLSKLFNDLTCIRALNLGGCSHKNILGRPAIKIFRERMRKLIHLRYLNLSHNSKIEGLLEAIWELCNLQSLDLSNCSIGKIQGGIKKLTHLRFLNLSHNKQLEELPEMLCELYCLQILDVSNCNCLEKLPHGIGKLINLRRIRNHGTSISFMPKGLQKLTSLQQLSKFAMSNDQKACSLECLANFKHLGGFLMITGLGNVHDLIEVNQGKLEDKENLLCMGLRFDGWMYDEDKVNFEKINPPPNLEELMIEYYIGKTMPLDWIMPLTKLRVLKLSSCFEFEELPPLGRLSLLESLYLWKMGSVKKVGKEFLGKEIDETSSSFSAFIAFPKLKYLTIWNMEEWEEWDYDINEDEDITIMPALDSLQLFSCPKLKAVPSHIFLSTTLKKLDIDSCPCIKSSEDLKPPPKSEDLKIQYYIGKGMPVSWIKSLANVKVLKLSSFSELEDLPALGQLLSLESLTIWNMGTIKKVGNEFLREKDFGASSSYSSFTAFPKLKYLTIEDMKEWEEWDYDIKEDEDITIMPALLTLKLYSCPKLKALPDHIFQSTTLEKDIHSCPCIKSSEDLKHQKSEELTIKYYRGKSIPVSWVKSLANLKVLNLWSCSELEDLPALGELLSLESLSIRSLSSVKKVGNGFLSEENIGKSSSSSSFTAFPKLNDLTVENMKEWEDWDYGIKEGENITIMPALRSFKIHSCPKLKAVPAHIFQSTALKELDTDSCPCIQISSNSGKFTMQYYMGKSIPIDWFKSLANLRELNLWSCSKLDDLPVLGELLSLELLNIRSMASVKKVGNRFLCEENNVKSSSSSSFTAFPNLKYLTIEDMKEWEEWDYDIKEDEDITIMPALLSLKIHSCLKLKRVTDHIFQSTALKELDADSCPCIQISPKSEKLTIQYCSGKSIPVSWFSSLADLKVLNLWSCSELENLPTLGELLSLESLSIQNMASVKKVGNQFLRKENDGKSSSSSSFTAFPSLKYLTIANMKELEEWDYVIKEDEYKTIMPALHSLKIHSCPKLKRVTDHIFQSAALKELDTDSCPCIQISPKSKKLTIKYYIGKSMPISWFKSLANLKELNLWSCSELENLPALGELLSMETLSIQNMATVKKVDNRFLHGENDGKLSSFSSFTAFPKLKYLTIEKMKEWEEWDYDITGDEVITIMPALLSLKIHSCPKLKRVTDHIFQSTTLKELEYTNSCPYIQISPKSEKLTIQYCNGKSIPVSWFKSLANLKVLNLWSCSELENLPTLGELLSLESLCIQNMASVKKVDNRFLCEENDGKSSSSSSFTAFPKLDSLIITSMYEWEQWDYGSVSKIVTIMPALYYLKLDSCPKLRMLPSHFFQKPTLQKLDISGCPCLEKRYEAEWHNIHHLLTSTTPVVPDYLT